MSYYSLNEGEYELFEGVVVEEQLLDAVHRSICPFTPSPYGIDTTWEKVMTPDIANLELWSLIGESVDNQSNILFKKQTDTYYKLAMLVSIPDDLLKIARRLNEPLDAMVVRQVVRKLDKELEAFVFKGPRLIKTVTRTHDTATEGLAAATAKVNAGNESTYDTIKFATATGPYNTIVDMIGKLQTDGFGYGKMDLVTDTTLAPYFKHLLAADAPTEYTRIKAELLNGGDIYISDQLPPKESDDGFLLLLDRSRKFFEVKTPRGLSLKNQFVWNPNTDCHVGRVEGIFALSVYEPNAICFHSNVDLVA